MPGTGTCPDGAAPAMLRTLGGVRRAHAAAPDDGTVKRIRWIGGRLPARLSRGGWARDGWTAHKLRTRTQAAGQPRSRCLPAPPASIRRVLTLISPVNTPPPGAAQHGPDAFRRGRRPRGAGRSAPSSSPAFPSPANRGRPSRAPGQGRGAMRSGSPLFRCFLRAPCVKRFRFRPPPAARTTGPAKVACGLRRAVRFERFVIHTAPPAP
jgi:hypothetical protein